MGGYTYRKLSGRDELARKRIGHPQSPAKAEKIKSLTLHTFQQTHLHMTIRPIIHDNEATATHCSIWIQSVHGPVGRHASCHRIDEKNGSTRIPRKVKAVRNVGVWSVAESADINKHLGRSILQDNRKSLQKHS